MATAVTLSRPVSGHTHKVPATQRKKRALHVEDDKGLWDKYRRVYKTAGYDVVMSGTFNGALGHLTAGERFDVYGLDGAFPRDQRYNAAPLGWELYEEIIKLHPEARVVFVSGDNNLAVRCKQEGVPFFYKPLDEARFIAHLRSLP